MITRLIDVLYAQFAIHDAQENYPFNLWSSDHVKQCLSWRESSICFKTTAENGPHLITIDQNKSNLRKCVFDTVIYCPVPISGRNIELSTHVDSFKFSLEDVNMIQYLYDIKVETPRIILNFFKARHTYFDIIKCDGSDFSGNIIRNSESAV